jgi:hypothetical protein
MHSHSIVQCRSCSALLFVQAFRLGVAIFAVWLPCPVRKSLRRRWRAGVPSCQCLKGTAVLELSLEGPTTKRA